jgi:cell division protein ZapA
MNARPTAEADQAITLDVTVLGREYKVACRAEERAELADAVAFLDRRMREIRDSGRISGIERIAVMAALNIANELLRSRREPPCESAVSGLDEAAMQRRIDSMKDAIDQVLAGA